MMREAIELFGGSTYVLLWVTCVLGLAKWKLRIAWIRPEYHYYAAVLTLILATTHLILVKMH